MKFTADPKEFLPPSPRYAMLAVALRECGIDIESDDCEMLDLIVKQADTLLEMRSVLNAENYCLGMGSSFPAVGGKVSMEMTR